MKENACTAIVLAAGRGRRMGTDIQKQYLHILGKPVVYYALKCFQDSEIIDDIILVTGEREITYCKEELVERWELTKVSQIVAGGEERFDSVYRGLQHCRNEGFVWIHDGARPFVEEAMLERLYEAVRAYGACVAAMPAKDTVKLADERGFVAETPERSRVWMIQTPQVFSYTLISEAYERLMENPLPGITDDAMVVESILGHPIKLVEGAYRNMKITTPEDMAIAEAFAIQAESRSF